MNVNKADNHPTTEPTGELHGKPINPDESTSALAIELRTAGRTWVAIADSMRERFEVNAFVALRLAHNWTRQHAAEEWNKRWPDDPTTGQNLLFWESWPTRDGYPPTLLTLHRLAELYQCAVSDVLVGVGDFRHLDPVRHP